MRAVYLYYPNIIGYGRVALAVLSCFLAFDHWLGFMICYSLSQILDAFDGMVARHFNQSSKFGAVLDMVTDRCSTACLLAVLGAFYQRFFVVFAVLLMLDGISHYYLWTSAQLDGGRNHKELPPDAHWLLRLYYTNKAVMLSFCVGAEAFLLALYLLNFHSGFFIYFLLLAFAVPFAAKQACNVLQMIHAADVICDIEAADKAAQRGH
eukprot:gnl/Hemi2/7396_TR2523_c0_g13_i1.p1 gnl/Hemi2/7396_TR2523_c0_g13~~gnl/Hemi2/7396_TR2523_c0_g13_i1.p1  ORF type:complete len:231 (-),score=67.13 gnl/Hemi2/7396_TR2523_c0_g13_i1:130-753(-)